MGKDRKPEDVLAENYVGLRNKAKASGVWKGPGVSPKTANNVEHSRHNTKLSTVITLAKACGVEPFQMLVPNDEADFLVIMQAWAQSDGAGKDALLGTAEAMLERAKKNAARSDSPSNNRKRGSSS